MEPDQKPAAPDGSPAAAQGADGASAIKCCYAVFEC